MQLSCSKCKPDPGLGDWVTAGATIISSLFGGKSGGPYTVCDNLTVDKATVDAAKTANLPGVPQFDGRTGWSETDCVRMRAFLSTQGNQISNGQNVNYPVSQNANYNQYIFIGLIGVAAYLMLRK